MDIEFLGLEDVLEIHRDQIDRYGGMHGVRDHGLLESALAMPRSGMGGEYFHSTLFEMAAAYLFHLVRNHAFHDGNKRVGTMAAYAFLSLNGVQIDAPDKQFEALILEVAQGGSSKSAVAEFLAKHAQ